MSQRYEAAKLKRFRGPWFPEPGITRLTALYDQPVGGQNAPKRLDNVAKQVRVDGKDGWSVFTKVLKAPVTSDGHRWLVGYEYKTSHGYIVVVLLPRQPRGVSVRHIAMYTRGWKEKDPPPVLSQIAEKFAWTLEVKGF